MTIAGALWVLVALVQMIRSTVDAHYGAAPAWFALLAMVPLAIELLFARPRTFRVKRIEASWIWLEGVHPVALDSLAAREEQLEVVLETRVVAG